MNFLYEYKLDLYMLIHHKRSALQIIRKIEEKDFIYGVLDLLRLSEMPIFTFFCVVFR